MTSQAFETVKKRVRWLRYEGRARKAATPAEFLRLMADIKDPVFQGYEAWDETSRRDIAAALDALSIDLRGARFLDIGPGYGSALDVARERGAACSDFVDYDPFVCAFNNLKGHSGRRIDARRGLSKLVPSRYEFIWMKATFSADRFVDRHQRGPGFLSLYPDLETILSDLDRLIAPLGRVVFCPHWATRSGQRVVRDVRDSSVAVCLQRRGYRALPWIDGHNQEPMYPITFTKAAPSIAADH
jgi:SAM-dependent methyltransferase